MQAFIDSDDAKRHLDVMEDGWRLLSVAGVQLGSLIPQEFAKLKREHGERSLHKLVAAIDLFDIQSENTPNGGTRAVYRTRT